MNESLAHVLNTRVEIQEALLDLAREVALLDAGPAYTAELTPDDGIVTLTIGVKPGGTSFIRSRFELFHPTEHQNRKTIERLTETKHILRDLNVRRNKQED